jgi:hypothetical protein
MAFRPDKILSDILASDLMLDVYPGIMLGAFNHSHFVVIIVVDAAEHNAGENHPRGYSLFTQICAHAHYFLSPYRFINRPTYYALCSTSRILAWSGHYS